MNTESQVITPDEQKAIETCHPMVDEDWQALSNRIPVDIDTLARETKALQRRREVKSALDLLRLVLAYSVCDWPLRLVGVWATVIGLGRLSDVATRKRLRHCQAWLGRIIGAWLQQRRSALPRRPITVRLVDASSGSRPGSHRIDWRLHVTFDLASFSLTGAQVTDVKGGETLARHPTAAGDLVVADRGYAHRRGLGTVLSEAAYVLVRTNGPNVPLEGWDGQPFALLPWLQAAAGSAPREVPVWVTTPLGRFPLRLVAQPLPAAAAEKARRQTQAKSRKKGHTPTELSLVAAGFVLLLTNLPGGDWSAEDVAGVYRLRWQVEIVFTQMTKADVLTAWMSGDHVPDLHLDVVGHNDPVDQQLDQLPFLLKGRACQSMLHSSTKILKADRQTGQFGLPIYARRQLLGLLFQGHLPLLQILTSPLIFG